MAGLRALLGIFPKTSEYENFRNSLEEEYNALIAFSISEELKDYLKLEKNVKSAEFEQKKKEIFSLRFNQTDDYLKEKEFLRLKKSGDIKLYYKTKESQDLLRFNKIEKSKELEEYKNLDSYVKSAEFAKAKQEASVSAKKKFLRSDLYKTLQQFQQQKNSESIKGYYKFVNSKFYSDYNAALKKGIAIRVNDLKDEINSSEFREKKSSMKKSEFKESPEYQKIVEYKSLLKSKEYKNYLKLHNSHTLKYYNDLKGSIELESFEDLQNFILSDEFKQQKKEIESRSFKDTKEYLKLQRYNELKDSDDIRFYFKFKKSKENKNFNNLDGSERIQGFERVKEYIESDEFIKHKKYCTQSPNKRWQESKEFALLQKYYDLKASEKFVWYYKNIDSKRFSWHRTWLESFSETFDMGKIDTKKWMTKYYWGEEMLKDSYSLSYDKHFVTDGKNIEFDHDKLEIITREENIKGKSWHHTMGFITREFGYTSGLISTGKSFRQKYGTFEAKIKFCSHKKILNAFWMVAKTQVPHIDVAKAAKKVIFGNAWGNARDLKSIRIFKKGYNRGKLSSDYFIYTLEWKPNVLTWKINGVEVASTRNGVPEEPMYIVLSAGLQEEVNGILPAKMEVDWVRCFQHSDFLNN